MVRMIYKVHTDALVTNVNFTRLACNKSLFYYGSRLRGMMITQAHANVGYAVDDGVDSQCSVT